MGGHEEADVLIIGGGSAGAVLASRLSEDPARRVLLVEAGRDIPPGDVPADIADTFPSSYSNKDYFWPGLVAGMVPGTPPRHFTQARVMGGGSSLMGQWALRGIADDYDGWAKAGARGWGWSDVLPYFCRLERDLDRGGNAHGHQGPVPIRRIPHEQWPAFARAVERAAAARGIAAKPDINGDDVDGFFPLPFSQDDGVRASAAHCYLTAEVRRRPNLRILPHTRVRTLVLEGTRAVGAEAVRDDVPLTLRAREVIVSAGAIHTPALLMRSGIGPADALKHHGIAPVADRPGVGRNLQNHVFLHIALTLAPGARQSETLRNYGVAAMRVSSGHPDGGAGDLLVTTIGRISAGAIGTRAGIMTAKLYQPLSRGTVALNGIDRDGEPLVDFRLLDDPRDGDRMTQAANIAGALLCDAGVAALVPDAFMLPPEPPLQKLNRFGAAAPLVDRFAAGLLDAPASVRRAALAAVIGRERMLDRSRAPTPFAADLVRSSVAPMFHPAGTCVMGTANDRAAVVDAQCRVHGIAGLRVVDASVMPTVPRANTNIPTIMVAERAADLIREAPA